LILPFLLSFYFSVSSQKPRAKGLQRGKAASYKIALAILYIDIDWKKKPEARTSEINPYLLRSYIFPF
jgi:hypothetical protein